MKCWLDSRSGQPRTPARRDVLKVAFKWLRLSRASERVSPRVFDQFAEPLMGVGVVIASIVVIVSPVVGEMDP